MTAPLAVFRCDASPAIGAGHVTRCIALAEALAETGWRILFAIGPETAATLPALAAGGFEILVLEGAAAAEPAKIQGRISGEAALLVVDHYGRDATFEKQCRGWVHRILVLDDNTGRNHECDILVDAAANAPLDYEGHVPRSALVLVGPRYALIRQLFVHRRAEALAHRHGGLVQRVFVSFGATDPLNVTPIVLDVLGRVLAGVEVNVALSSNAPHLDEVRARARQKVRLMLDPLDMAELMAQSDLAIGAAGVTTYERAVLGLPSIVVVLADNQRDICRLVTEAGAAVDAGTLDKNFAKRLAACITDLVGGSEARSRMSLAASDIIDGHGPRRILAVIAGEAVAKDGRRVRMRRAEATDETWLLALQRAPQTRAHFKNPGIPTAEEHHHWMRRTLCDNDIFLAIVEVDGARAGMIRLDRTFDAAGANAYAISVAVSPAMHGQGIGSAALALARRLMPTTTLIADVLPANAASKSLFLRAGFILLDRNRYQSCPSRSTIGLT